ncbi:hypothetical protein [Chondromyces apiculatus]|uniref:Uncharacterized protein n=1 Tax=Chondromyces apiculatus DSM 436 TaxID=1192034 RepID=A0A017SUB1_9BACT|nr:hypothetical protein [Chondromyces apiculatus]EYF00529.1 Hypothetical protein CAP_0511 [Chondromyces apiculatus DSM 436]
MSQAPWEAYLAARFPAYLLPEACHQRLPEAAAAQFLERLGGDPGQLGLLLAASLAARHAAVIEAFALEALPDLLQRHASRLDLAARASRGSSPRPSLRTFEGRLPGRLDVQATLRQRLAGRPTRFVTRAHALLADRPGDPPPPLDRPEDRLLHAAARRLLGLLTRLDAAGLREGSSLVRGADCMAAIGHALAHPALAAMPATPMPTPAGRAEEDAAMAAPHPAYPLAARLHRALRQAEHTRDPALLAQIVADGALAPLRAPTRFELAVLLRLVEALDQALAARAPGRFHLRRTAVVQGRSEIAVLEASGGPRLRVLYNQACLPPGPHEVGVRWYLGQQGRLRPDITVLVEVPGAPVRALIVEAKLSGEPAYLAQGFQQALLYRLEYGPALTGWPRVVMVIPGHVAASAREHDDVVVTGWDGWVGETLLRGILDGL